MRYNMLLLSLCVILCIFHAIGDEVTFGNVRVQTLSPRLIRVEYKGPTGFENRTTLMVVNRKFPGVPITNVNTGPTTVITTAYYKVSVTQTGPPSDICALGDSFDVVNPSRAPNFANGVAATNAGDCCSKCQSDQWCKGWVYAPGESGVNCWPLATWSAIAPTSGRQFGCLRNGCFSAISSITVTDPNGVVVFQQQGQPDPYGNLLHWPSPLSSAAYAVTDFPRFYVPPWGPSPQTGLADTNGYDFTNNQNGDQYIFLLGNSLDSWLKARADFVTLTGPSAIIPNYAYGTWFTWWHSYTESEAKGDIDNWHKNTLPLDIYGLDMNWRLTDDKKDRFYNYPNTQLFANLSEWFAYLHSNQLHTYFNDHPFPVDMQTSAKEINFRWEGLTGWLDKGLDFWWFDHNWGFSIPPPNVLPVGGWDASYTDGNWFGLDNAAWGTHVFWETVSQYYKKTGKPNPLTLTKFAPPDWRPGYDSTGHREHPAHHRYPVWWTGDGVPLQGSVESMVDSGVHDFKAHVHSDCGGDYRGTAGDLLRWTAHCVFGTVLRFHGDDHRPWTYDGSTTDTIRSYLTTRYKLIPSFISAGYALQFSGFPIVARGDLFWPEIKESATNQQYIHLNDTLVAPIWDTSSNPSTRSVWVPPGDWQDAWDGSIVTGPKTISVSQPFERQPMWHRRGGLVVITDSPGERVEQQDWSVLTLEVFPNLGESCDGNSSVVVRSVYSLENAARTDIVMETVPSQKRNSFWSGALNFKVSASTDGISRGWVVRLHLLPGQICSSAILDGKPLHFVHFKPASSFVFPFGGSGMSPAAQAGPVAEVRVPMASTQRELSFIVE